MQFFLSMSFVFLFFLKNFIFFFNRLTWSHCFINWYFKFHICIFLISLKKRNSRMLKFVSKTSEKMSIMKSFSIYKRKNANFLHCLNNWTHSTTWKMNNVWNESLKFKIFCYFNSKFALLFHVNFNDSILSRSILFVSMKNWIKSFMFFKWKIILSNRAFEFFRNVNRQKQTLNFLNRFR